MYIYKISRVSDINSPCQFDDKYVKYCYIMIGLIGVKEFMLIKPKNHVNTLFVIIITSLKQILYSSQNHAMVVII